MTGYRVRITETAGSQLCRILPYTNPWKGPDCQRANCYTCSQGDEKLVDCKQRNFLYESICQVCNPEEEKSARKDGKVVSMEGVYVGESARSIYERAGEHWADTLARKRKAIW